MEDFTSAVNHDIVILRYNVEKEDWNSLIFFNWLPLLIFAAYEPQGPCLNRHTNMFTHYFLCIPNTLGTPEQ